MGRLLVIDGPEKAGKTTLCRLLEAEAGFKYRHWPPVKSELEYCRAIRGDQASTDDWLWDRSWASECVYGTYFNRDSRFAKDHWLSHWLCGYPAKTTGLLVMLPWYWGEHDETDLAIPQHLEAEAFRTYAEYFGWFVPTPGPVESIAEQVMDKWLEIHQWEGAEPPAWVGDCLSPVAVVGEERNDPSQWSEAAPQSPYPGPFSSSYTTRFARALGFSAFDVAWTNAAECAPELLSAKYVVACGNAATKWCESLRDPLDVVSIDHPAHFYRWGLAKRDVKVYESHFVSYVRRALDFGAFAASNSRS